MESFVQKHAALVTGLLSGFDRLVFRGTLRAICYAAGLGRYLNANNVLLKDFGKHVQWVTGLIKAASLHAALVAGRPVQYLSSPQTRKAEVAQEIARRDRIKEGLVCVLTCVEPCQSFEVYRNGATRQLELQPRVRKCLHYYHYWMHPRFGFMNARLQTWFPLSIQVCLNGREWLARTMDRHGLRYVRRDNCFTWLEDAAEAQKLMAQQLRTEWPQELNKIARRLNPAQTELFKSCPLAYYWSGHQSEWATDVMFRSSASLAQLYPRLIRHGLTTFGSAEVMRFLGRKTPADGKVHKLFAGEVVSELQERPEGVRLRHRVNGNAVKMYDKQGCILRVETTVNQPREFKVYRAAEGAPRGKKDWRMLRRGVADLQRRAEVSQACNNRYLRALAKVEEGRLLGELVQGSCRPVQWRGRRRRALLPWGEDDALLASLGRGEFCLNGFRNRDLRNLLHPAAKNTKEQTRRLSAQVTRKLRLLRAHGLIRKVSRTHRYQLTEKGRSIVVALSAAKQASVKKLSEIAA